VLSLSLAFSLLDEKVWDRVGVEPSGTAFNSLVQLESEEGIPRNPLMNAGAMVIADIPCTELENPKKEFLEFVRSATNRPTDFERKQIKATKRDHADLWLL
jgi:glutaminase